MSEHEGSAAADVQPSATALVADPVLLAARTQAREALAEITDADTIGADTGHEVHDSHVLTLFFECNHPGYPGWRWAATLARVDEESPVNVLEVELLPGADAVVAPDWVPWSERLSQYRETQARQAVEETADAEAAAAELEEEDDVDGDDDLMTNDFSDFDDEFDGVELEGEDDDDDDDESDDDSDDDDDSDLDEAEVLDLTEDNEAEDSDEEDGDEEE